jgi:peptidoglycan/xylan/chitin deacetylase (PgdA/CDA1 family)
MARLRARTRAARERRWLLQARRLEARQRRSSVVRGAAIVLHAVGPRAGDRELELDPALEVGLLEGVIAYLARRYRLVRASELLSAARERKRDEPLPIAVTFDDDLPSHRAYAAPVLERHGAVATAFLCGAPTPLWFQLLQPSIDGRRISAGDLSPIPPVLVAAALERRGGAIGRLAKAIEDLSPAERDRITRVLEGTVKDPPRVLGPEGTAALAAAGWELGFHTRNHDLLTTLGNDVLDEALERRPIGPDSRLPRTLAYPHGKATAREAAAARRAGYVAAFTGFPDVLSERTDPYLIGRLQPDTGTLGRFALHLARALAAA